MKLHHPLAWLHHAPAGGWQVSPAGLRQGSTLGFSLLKLCATPHPALGQACAIGALWAAVVAGECEEEQGSSIPTVLLVFCVN